MENFDVIIIGKGPAGISASLYTLRAGCKTAIVAKDGGALEKADRIENYYGIESITGRELISRGVNQAKSLGAEIFESEVVSLAFDGLFCVRTTETTLKGRSLILATGAGRMLPDVRNLGDFVGKGVSLCATCDAFFFRNKKVAVIGSGAYALEEVKALSNSDVTVLTDGEAATVDFSDYKTVDKKIKSVEGDGRIEKVVFCDGSELPVDGIFVAVGQAGSVELATKLGAVTMPHKLDYLSRYVQIDEFCATNVPGLFAAGDCTDGLKQVSKAVADGAVAGTSAARYLKHNR